MGVERSQIGTLTLQHPGTHEPKQLLERSRPAGATTFNTQYRTGWSNLTQVVLNVVAIEPEVKPHANSRCPSFSRIINDVLFGCLATLTLNARQTFHILAFDREPNTATRHAE